MNDAEYDGPLRVNVSLILAQSYWEQGRYHDASMTLTSVRENVQSTVSVSSDIVLASLLDDILHAEGQFALMRGLFSEAGKIFVCVLEGRKEYLSRSHPKIAAVQMDLAQVCTQTCDFANALTHIESALGVVCSIYAIAGGDEGLRLFEESYQKVTENVNVNAKYAEVSNVPDDGSTVYSNAESAHIIDRTPSPSLTNTLQHLETHSHQSLQELVNEVGPDQQQEELMPPAAGPAATATSKPVQGIPASTGVRPDSAVTAQLTADASVESAGTAKLYQFLASKHPVVATALYHKAMLQCNLGQYLAAEKNMLSVFNGRKHLFGRTHSHLQTLKYIQKEQQLQSWINSHKTQQQLPYLQMVQMQVHKLSGANNGNHPAIAEAMYGLGEILKHMYVLKEALDFHERALAMKRECLQMEIHSHIAESIFAIAQTFLFTGNYTQALVAFEHSLALFNELMVIFDVTVHLSDEVNKVWLAYVYAVLNRFDDAQVILGESGKRICGVVGNKHVRVAEGDVNILEIEIYS
jgi:tetratricopeptide (TPR) repeat protein